MTSPLIELKDVTVVYGNVPAVTGASLHVNRGEIVALVGPNGAGKTTLTKAVMGRLRIVAGSVDLNGQRIRGAATRQLMRRGVSLVPEGRRLIGELTVEDNLRLGGIARRWRGATDADLDEVYGLFPRLKERRHVKAAMISGGEQQMAAIGRALVMHPSLLVLDEPSLGLAPMIVQQLFETFERLRENGTTILIAEQNVRDTLRLASRAYVMVSGHIVLEGDSKELVASNRLQDLYLLHRSSGGSADHNHNQGGVHQ